MYEKKLAGSDDGDAMKKDKIKEVSVHACLCLCVCVSDSADCAEEYHCLLWFHQAMDELAAKEREAERILALDERKRPYPLHTRTHTHTHMHHTSLFTNSSAPIVGPSLTATHIQLNEG